MFACEAVVDIIRDTQPLLPLLKQLPLVLFDPEDFEGRIYVVVAEAGDLEALFRGDLLVPFLHSLFTADIKPGHDGCDRFAVPTEEKPSFTHAGHGDGEDFVVWRELTGCLAQERGHFLPEGIWFIDG